MGPVSVTKVKFWDWSPAMKPRIRDACIMDEFI